MEQDRPGGTLASPVSALTPAVTRNKLTPMEIIAGILIFLGIILAFFSNIWFLVAAFRVGLGWGLACLFLPIVSLFFLIVHWDVAKRPFGYMLLSIVIMVIGIFLMPGHQFPQH